jgi:hypothetical protein
VAKTYTAAAIGIAFASNKSLLGLYNAHASRKVRVYRAWTLNNQTTAVTGVLTALALRKISALSGGTALTPVAHDTGNTSIDLTSVTCNTNGSFTNTLEAQLRTWVWSTDEPAVSSGTSDEFQCLVPLNCIWDSTGDSNIEPITLNTNEGVHILQPGSNAVGILDLFLEFTVSAS